MDTKKEVTRFLLEYEFPTRLNGYQYFKECLIIVLTEVQIPSNKILFTNLAESHNTDTDNIERCLLTLVDKMWQALSYAGIFHERPTIREFITKCAEFISIDTTRPKSAYDIIAIPDSKFSN